MTLKTLPPSRHHDLLSTSFQNIFHTQHTPGESIPACFGVCASASALRSRNDFLCGLLVGPPHNACLSFWHFLNPRRDQKWKKPAVTQRRRESSGAAFARSREPERPKPGFSKSQKKKKKTTISWRWQCFRFGTAGAFPLLFFRVSADLLTLIPVHFLFNIRRATL